MIAGLNASKAQQGVCFGIKVGANLENIIGLNSGQGVVGVTENESSEMTFGFHAGVFLRWGLDDHWAIVPELLYTTGGAKETIAQTYYIGNTAYTSSTTGNISLHYLQLPVFVNYQFDMGLYLEGGLYIAGLIGTTTSSTTTSNGVTKSSTSTSDTTNNQLDWGVGAGVGYRFCNGLGFNLRYNYGLYAVYKNFSYENQGVSYRQPSYGNNGVLQLSVSYLFGCSNCVPKPQPVAEVIPEKTPPPPAPEPDVQFAVKTPESLPGQHTVIEILPVRDYVFFDAGNLQIPSRYKTLSPDQAASFHEEQLQDCQKNPGTRQSRQLNVYYNVLNIVGDRMRKYPSSTIKLVGSSAGKGADLGKANAETVKTYLVTNFGIKASRIATEGRDMPIVQSEIPNGTRDKDLTKVEDFRVDIISTSTDLVMEVNGNSALCLKPLEVTSLTEDEITDNSPSDPNKIDYPVNFTVNGASDVLNSWTIDITDSKGATQHYGPYTGNSQALNAEVIIQDQNSGTYQAVMTGQTKTGKAITKKTSFTLNRRKEPIEKEQRYSILFEFDKSKTVATYDNFLRNTVAPNIPPNSTVTISGHTDIVGPEDYNMNLSNQRATEAQKILENELNKENKTGITFKTKGYGVTSPEFSNMSPEGRFYNRTVIIDIVPNSSMGNR